MNAAASAPNAVALRLLAWYDRHARVLPWRSPPGERADPYVVWLSEIMLQQTTVVTVGPYFAEFLRRWPTVGDLAAAPVEEVLAAWAGLGYYARARNLHKCARHVAENLSGRFPDDEAGLLTLPGVGPYTAAAVAAIAFDRPATVVDGNVERVVARRFAVEQPFPDAKPEVRRLAATLTPTVRPGDFAQAMMDLGATICAPAKANCLLCPIAEDCRGRATGEPESYPRKRDKAAKPTRVGVAFFLTDRRGNLLLERRPPKGLLGGMVGLPGTVWREGAPFSTAEADAAAPAPGVGWVSAPGTVRHVFTHFTLELTVRRGAAPVGFTPGDGRFWAPLNELDGVGLPTVMAKVVRHGLEQPDLLL
jgi:A/G-specific adenine glycosylase